MDNNFSSEETFKVDNYGNVIDENTNKKNKLKIVVVGIIIIAAFEYLFSCGLNYYYTHDSYKTSADLLVLDKLDQKVTISSIDFFVPSSLSVISNDYSFWAKDGDNFTIRVEVQEADFNNIYERYTHLRGNADAKYNGNQKRINYDGKDYVTVETAGNFKKMLIAFTDGGNGKIIIVGITNKNNTYDYGLLEKVSPIINSATR